MSNTELVNVRWLPICFLTISFFGIASTAQTPSKSSYPATTMRKLTVAEKRELDFVLPPKIRGYLVNSKSLFVTDVRSKRTIELSDAAAKKELLDSIFSDVGAGRKVEDTCRTPEYWIESESDRSKVFFTISYNCNDITGSGLGRHLIQGRLDGKNSRSKPILEQLFAVPGS